MEGLGRAWSFAPNPTPFLERKRAKELYCRKTQIAEIAGGLQLHEKALRGGGAVPRGLSPFPIEAIRYFYAERAAYD